MIGGYVQRYCYIAITEHDERRPGLPSAPDVMKHDNNRTEK